MTLLQLKYIVTVAAAGTISEAAKQLYIAQPSLTSAIKELENELGITIFKRTNKGILLSAEGEEFLGYARQVIEQTNLIEERYLGKTPVKHQFCVSTQHYSFAVEAFVELLSEVGVLYLNSFNEAVLRKTMRENDLKFHRLFIAKPHVFVSTFSPLAKKKIVELDELATYPRLSYEQGEHNSFYFSEEILSTLESKKDIMVSDRATLFNLLIGLNGYTICSGVINEELNGKNIVAVPLAVDDYMEIGYITHSKVGPGKFGTLYIEALKRYASAQE